MGCFPGLSFEQERCPRFGLTLERWDPTLPEWDCHSPGLTPGLRVACYCAAAVISSVPVAYSSIITAIRWIRASPPLSATLFCRDITNTRGFVRNTSAYTWNITDSSTVWVSDLKCVSKDRVLSTEPIVVLQTQRGLYWPVFVWELHIRECCGDDLFLYAKTWKQSFLALSIPSSQSQWVLEWVFG